MADYSRPQTTASPKSIPLSEIAYVFLRLGTIAFGGPAAHIAMMEDEIVRKRAWITQAEFLDRLAAASLIPGPSSTELGIFIGQSKRGWKGLIVAGGCFIVPAAFVVTLLAAVYVRYGSLPQVAGVLYGIKPAVIAIILQALWNLSRTAIKTGPLAAIAIVSIVLNALGVSPLVVLAFAGISSGVRRWFNREVAAAFFPGSPVRLFGWLIATGAGAAAVPVGLLRLFLSFLKIGAVVFGSGYVLLAFLRAEFIAHLHWLTEQQLIDAVAVGQFTPGPVFTTATFIGYLVAGIPGAFLATVAIFLPGFLLVAASGSLVSKIRRSATAAAILDGVVAGSLALMAVVAWQLARAAIVDWRTLLILCLGTVLVLRLRVNSVWVIAGAALAGWLLH